MRIFAFDPEEFRAEYAAQGWVHIRAGIDPEFLDHLRRFTAEHLSDHKLPDFAIRGKKEQARFEFPDDVDYPDELYNVVAALCGLDRASIVLSERHIQAYEPNAAPEPPAHKDRLGSQVSVGLSIDIPGESRLVLYPFSHRELNPFNKSAALRTHLEPAELPEVALKTARAVELADRPGDVVAFPGSTTWHLRRRAAGAVNLYLKFNDFNCDPLGEDPGTEARRAASAAAIRDGAAISRSVPAVGRRLDSVQREYTRNTWQEHLVANLYGEAPFRLSELDVRLLKALDGRRTWDEVVAGDVDADRALRRLVELGAVDVVPDSS